VALVLKPHAFHPTRAGFFFRETNGSIHGTSSYQEFDLAPLPARPLPQGVAPAMESTPFSRLRRGPDPRGAVIAVAAEQADQAPAVPTEPAPEVKPADPPLPSFLAPPAERKSRWLVLTIALSMAAAAVGYQAQRLWLPRLTAAIWPGSQFPIGLNAIDSDGQLQIQWDGNSTAVRQATNAILEIDDGSVPWEIQLDAPHLKAGTFTYSRQGERVDIKLAIHLRDGQQARGAASFLGKLPARKPPPEDPEIRKQRDALAQEAAKLKSDLAAEEARTRKLEKSLDEVQKVLQEQQRTRLENQSPDR
jgi:hypothetical protein